MGIPLTFRSVKTHQTPSINVSETQMNIFMICPSHLTISLISFSTSLTRLQGERLKLRLTVAVALGLKFMPLKPFVHPELRIFHNPNITYLNKAVVLLSCYPIIFCSYRGT
jgi:hypothetical protein